MSPYFLPDSLIYLSDPRNLNKYRPFQLVAELPCHISFIGARQYYSKVLDSFFSLGLDLFQYSGELEAIVFLREDMRKKRTFGM